MYVIDKKVAYGVAEKFALFALAANVVLLSGGLSGSLPFGEVATPREPTPRYTPVAPFSEREEPEVTQRNFPLRI